MLLVWAMLFVLFRMSSSSRAGIGSSLLLVLAAVPALLCSRVDCIMLQRQRSRRMQRSSGEQSTPRKGWGMGWRRRRRRGWQGGRGGWVIVRFCLMAIHGRLSDGYCSPGNINSVYGDISWTSGIIGRSKI